MRSTLQVSLEIRSAVTEGFVPIGIEISMVDGDRDDSMFSPRLMRHLTQLDLNAAAFYFLTK